MSRTNKIISMTVLLVFACTAFAQETVGALLDAGATKVTKQGVMDALAGTKITGATASGRAEMNIDLKADGVLSGYLVAQSGSISSTVGKWWVEDDGKACVDEQLVAWNMQHKECWHTYIHGSQAYRTIGDSADRSAKVIKTDAKVTKIDSPKKMN